MIRVAVRVQSRVLRSTLERRVAQNRAFTVVAVPTAASGAALTVPLADVMLVDESDHHPLASSDPRPAIIVMSEAPDERLVASARRNGARGVLSYASNPRALHAAIEAAAAGLFVSDGGSEETLEVERHPVESYGVTPREREVLTLLASGLPNRAIGVRLGISEHTVKTYVASILDKLDARSRAEAVAIGQRRGLILL